MGYLFFGMRYSVKKMFRSTVTGYIIYHIYSGEFTRISESKLHASPLLKQTVALEFNLRQRHQKI